MTTDPTCECGAPLPYGDGSLRCPACGRDHGSIVARPDSAPETRITDEPIDPADDTPLSGGAWARDVSLPSAGLSSPAAVFVAVFLCGPMAGVLLMARNDGVLRRRWGGWGVLLAGAIFCLVEGAVLSSHSLSWQLRASLPGSTAAAVVSCAPPCRVSSFTGYQVAASLLNLVLFTTVAAVLYGKEALRRKGAGAVVPRALLGLLLSYALVVGGAYAGWWLTSDPPDAVIVVAPGKQVQHSRRCPEAEARALGKFLMDEQVFGGPNAPREQGPRLDREGDVVVVSFWLDVKPKAEDRDFYALLAFQLSGKVFNRSRVVIRLLDAEGKLRTSADSERGEAIHRVQQPALLPP